MTVSDSYKICKKECFVKIQYCRVMAVAVVFCITFFLVGGDKGFEEDRSGVPKTLSVFTEKMREVFGGRPMNGMYQRGFHVVLESFDSARYSYPQPFELYIGEVAVPIEFGDKNALNRYMKERTRPALEVSLGTQVYRIHVEPPYIKLFQPCYRIDLSRFCSAEISAQCVLYAIVALFVALPEVGGAIFLPAEWFHFSYEAGAGRQLLADRFYDLACAIFAPSCKIKKYFTDSILLKQEEVFLAKVEDSPVELALLDQHLDIRRPAASSVALRYFKHTLSKWGNMRKALVLLLRHILAGDTESCVCILDLIFETSCSLVKMFGYPGFGEEVRDAASESIDSTGDTESIASQSSISSLSSVSDGASTVSAASSESAGSESDGSESDGSESIVLPGSSESARSESAGSESDGSESIVLPGSSESADLESEEEDSYELELYRFRLGWFTKWWHWYVASLSKAELRATFNSVALDKVFSQYAVDNLNKNKYVVAGCLKDWITDNVVNLALGGRDFVTRHFSGCSNYGTAAVGPVCAEIRQLYAWGQDTPIVYGFSEVFVDPLK